MNIENAIYRRKSIRKYKNSSISEEDFDFINKLIKEVPRLYPKIEMNIELIKDGEKIQDITKGIVGSYGKIEAPHYLVITSEEKSGYLENIGYTLEEIVLELADRGIGTCWIGGFIKKNLLKDVMTIKENHKPVIVISFGYPENEQELDVKESSSFKRKKLEEVIYEPFEDKWVKIFDKVRVAPSAVNLQPWVFTMEGDTKIEAFAKTGNLITKKLMHFSDLDVGIAIKHLELACKEENIKTIYTKTPHDLKGLKYILTIELENV